MDAARKSHPWTREPFPCARDHPFNPPNGTPLQTKGRTGLKTTPLFVTVPDLLGWLQSLFSSNGCENLLRAYETQPALVLDDMGAEKMSEWSFTIVYRLLSHRINHDLSTIITSNLPLREIDAWEPRVASRLCEWTVIELSGKDRRLDGKSQCPPTRTSTGGEKSPYKPNVEAGNGELV